jgi:hypothetical protein
MALIVLCYRGNKRITRCARCCWSLCEKLMSDCLPNLGVRKESEQNLEEERKMEQNLASAIKQQWNLSSTLLQWHPFDRSGKEQE